VTPLGQLALFIKHLKQKGLFDSWVAGCPMPFASPNAPGKRDVLGAYRRLFGFSADLRKTAEHCQPSNAGTESSAGNSDRRHFCSTRSTARSG
jgi:hypothetical protein